MKLSVIAFLIVFSSGKSLATVWPVGAGKENASIRATLAKAQSGDTLEIHPGAYREGNLVVDKPLTLLGIDFPILDGMGEVEILTIKAPNVTVWGFQIQHSGVMSTIDLAGIKVLATSGVRIENNRVYDCNFGIYLSNVTHGTIRKNDIHGTPNEEQNTGNGIHLWKCDSALIEENYITGQRDGIYFEFVTNSEIRNNLSELNLRYGLHFMFSHNDRYTHNRFSRNGAGVAVMYSHKVQMFENRFEYNWGSAAYGILLKDISDSHIWQNYFEHNSAGIYLEGASRILIEENTFRENGWALRIQASCDGNTIQRNDFFTNTFDVSTNGSLVLNQFDSNYWDRYEGYDLNRDGIGDVPFRPVNLYAVVVERMPFSLLLIRSFMVYLLEKAEKIMPSLTPEKLLDEHPQMTPILQK